MRNMNTADVFRAMRIIKAAGVSEEIKRVGLAANAGKVTAEELGMELIFSIIEKASSNNCEALIYEFIGSLLEIPSGEVAEMDPFELIENLKELKNHITSDRAKSFFRSLAELTK